MFDGVGLELGMDLLVMGNQAKHGRYEAGQSGKQTRPMREPSHVMREPSHVAKPSPKTSQQLF